MTELSTPFPPPPMFYKLYTDPPTLQMDGLSLTSLAPPPPPAPDEEYECFGVKRTWNEPLKTLEDAGLPVLFKEITKDELLKLNFSFFFNFTELLEILTSQPELYPEKLNDIKVILMNYHYLMNLYRDHQARDLLEYQLQQQIDKKKQWIQTLKDSIQKIQEKLCNA
jgi:mediator of RNA polymerase II transcription subunit 7